MKMNIAIGIMMLVAMSIGWLFSQASLPLIRAQIDIETGCEYMVNRNGGVTPRIDADGVHMGCKGLQGERK